MTDGEPEPFRMPTDLDAEQDPDGSEPGNDADDGGFAAADEPAARGESIADLIDEAARTAAEQAEAEAMGRAPEDRSAEVWGNGDGGGEDAAAVWQQSEDHAASNVWDSEDEGGDAVWGSPAPTEDTAPPPTADPARRPAAAAGMPATSDEEEPETFTFPAGPETTTAAPVADQPGTDEEPEAFTFAVAGDGDQGAAAEGATEQAEPAPVTAPAASGADPVEEWTVPSAGAADGEGDVDDVEEADDVWTSSVASDDEAPLAERATPRDDAGWHDLEAEQEPTWSVPDLPVREGAGPDGAGDEEEPTSFVAALHDEDVEDDEDDEDAPWSSPALPEEPAGEDQDMPPADVVTAEVHDALGDLLGNAEEDAVIETGAAPTTTGTPATSTADAPPEPVEAEAAPGGMSFDLDHLDDLDDLENLEDMAAAVAPATDEATDEADAHGDDEDPAEGAERPLDAPTAARQVMEPGSVTFSSSGKKKKRGLFG